MQSKSDLPFPFFYIDRLSGRVWMYQEVKGVGGKGPQGQQSQNARSIKECRDWLSVFSSCTNHNSRLMVVALYLTITNILKNHLSQRRNTFYSNEEQKGTLQNRLLVELQMILIILIQNGDDEIVKVLVEAGADIDIQDQYLRFPLQLAAGVSTFT